MGVKQYTIIYTFLVLIVFTGLWKRKQIDAHAYSKKETFWRQKIMNICKQL